LAVTSVVSELPSSFGVMVIQLSTLGQLRVFPPLSSVLSLVCCLCEWQSILSVQRFLGRPRRLFPWTRPYRA